MPEPTHHNGRGRWITNAALPSFLPLSLLAVFTLCTKSVSQLFCSQALPHSFTKLPGVTQSSPHTAKEKL
jgi:hypothetical protein